MEENEGVWKGSEVTKERTKVSRSTPLTLSLGVALCHIRAPIGTTQIWGQIRRFWGRSRSCIAAHPRGLPTASLRPIIGFGALRVRMWG